MNVQQTIETMEILDVKRGFDRLVRRIARHQTRVIVAQNGVPVAGIVSVQDLRRLDQLDRERERRLRIFEEFSAGFADQTPEQIEREVACAIAEVRAELLQDSTATQ